MRPVAHQPISFVQDNTIPVPVPPSVVLLENDDDLLLENGDNIILE